jgi:hypothetical protein
MVRFRSERKCLTFKHTISRKFNSFVNNKQFIYLKHNDRSYKWSNLRIIPSFALLDRFLCSTSWENEFSLCISKSLPRYQLDHNVLILNTSYNNRQQNNEITRFEKSWIGNVEFESLLIEWWNSVKLGNDLGNNWKFKL